MTLQFDTCFLLPLDILLCPTGLFASRPACGMVFRGSMCFWLCNLVQLSRLLSRFDSIKVLSYFAPREGKYKLSFLLYGLHFFQSVQLQENCFCGLDSKDWCLRRLSMSPKSLSPTLFSSMYWMILTIPSPFFNEISFCQKISSCAVWKAFDFSGSTGSNRNGQTRCSFAGPRTGFGQGRRN